ncbi:hypothetical protein N7499_006236 [Penicillium canescens]|uniref:Uncharacterized protein n=1 Tax=Penicillium canescens TaxID=5083 RepID=A0AAD6IE63_PENCN|nr:uncharacterized protein N7446_002015 [Penicillium canescens]KAJ5997370.1 hypothetical protein N7522_009030 [Penicillium canescens]KAJ6043817.1 hypothetical protein N7460_005172 [Penicillium canescens]KAJ6055291.1 hypothetical protein N7444_004389 [Penicillium canescens]KAJ6074238.1 hypothetical protein N7446_002015 [Penicillium canescens]KAJ6081362.1 hypothetical protein N7499_006236 [Penicillium canescens]
MIPIQTRLRDMSLPKAAAPVASTDPAQVTFNWSGSSFESSPMSNPFAPPPTPCDSLLDIHPRKSSFSSEMGAAYAFPSWPNRPSLSSHDSTDSNASAYLTDDDLLWMPENAAAEKAVEEATNIDAELAHSITLEQQLQRIRAVAAEEEARANFLARVDAHARATHALRMAKMNVTATVNVNERDNAKRKKRRAVPSPKRRAHSASKVLSQ